jgi:hypothetical protein
LIDLNHRSCYVPGRSGNGRAAPSLSERINERIDAALLKAREAEPRRTYIAALRSSPGCRDWCGRCGPGRPLRDHKALIAQLERRAVHEWYLRAEAPG